MRLNLPRNAFRLLAGVLAVAAPIAAGDLDVRVESGGVSTVAVAPGAVVPYTVTGTLSDDANAGLAMFCFDLEFDGGALTQADAPVSTNMLNFTNPLGISNPAGFGGTEIGGRLVQVGGAQNTFNVNLFTPVPGGNLITGIASTTAPEVLATGTLTAPLEVGSYKLRVQKVKANAVQQGATGLPFWRVAKAGQGTVVDLTVVVEALRADIPTVSVGAGGTQTLSLEAGTPRAFRTYILLGSLSGTAPGTQILPGLVLPLNIAGDAWFKLSVNEPNQLPYSNNSFSSLDALGQSVVTVTIPPGTTPNLAGMTVNHAYVLLTEIDFVSNPVALTLVP